MILFDASQAETVRAATAHLFSPLDPVDLGHGVFGLPEDLAEMPDYAAALAGLPVGDPVAAVKDHLIAVAADLRWQRTLFFAYDGIPNAYADPAIVPLAAKILRLDEDERDDAVDWKLTARDWRLWNRTQLRAYGAAIDAHIEACFAYEKVLEAAIEAAPDLDALRAIDVSAGWP